MTTDRVNVTVSLPRDSDGFLRRACPSCAREHKRVVAGVGEEDAYNVAELHCPYCDHRAEPGAWFTSAQKNALREAALATPRLDDAIRGIGAAVRSLGGDVPAIERASVAIAERDDMRAVSLPCHPAERLKVLDDWSDAVRCTVCGAQV
jgi:DNA-directed RNA polymerase subunit RPC12/RpoP